MPNTQVTRAHPQPGVLSAAITVGSGFAAAQVAPGADSELATFLRVAGASVGAGLLGARAGSGVLTWGAVAASGIHGYKRSGGSLLYAVLWGLTGTVGLGVALGQGFGEPPRHLRGVVK